MSERCEVCGGDGILNRDLPKEKQEPIWTLVRFEGVGTAHTEPLTYFLKRVCSACNNRWQRLLLDDIKRVEDQPKPVNPVD